MLRRATENSGRYDHLHGDEDQFVPREHVSACHECGSTDGCLCAEHARQDAVLDADERRRRDGLSKPLVTDRWCSQCGCRPCESPSGCRAEARRENEETEDCDA